MKILVANNAAPFVRGGAELLAERLVVELRRAGHEAELLRLPLGDTPEQIRDGIIAATLLHAVNVDRIIGLKFPAYLIPHPDVVIWLVHQLRQAYDPPPVGWAPDPVLDPVVEAIHTADRAAFASATRLYAISPMIADRLQRSTGLEATVLMTPPHSEVKHQTQVAEDFILALGRISDGKRQRLAIQAMQHAQAGYRLVVAGAPDRPEDLDEIRREIDKAGIQDRVELIPRFITEDEKIDLLARCIGSVYLPIDEDSYGYVCYEAAMSNKPSITATDSGGTLTLVKHGETGLVAAPEPKALAMAFDEIALDRERAASMGRTAYDLAINLDLSWHHVIEELTR
ncbi:glycosyltransferase family 4 protein [Pengzhenrongella frigida]|uniref:Glycosyltransferase n=1 Tax=Pengzhenrongella frigida TaxID=1259133 RepID=A0A4Q5N016_9MICO|nr:glycosyltransferase family 4 protein [Cellulomonas sp. HLT2-17]RYV51346.1 glycosyltransferase [Cellulomonas sp. HLT2-17]